MCTLVSIRAPGTPFPLVVATNRDERLDRDSRPFGRSWPGEPFLAGRDGEAGGTWAAIHDEGFGVFVLNGASSLGPSPGKRSRGRLVLDLVRSGSAGAAGTRLERLDAHAYRPFHVVVASAAGALGATFDGSRMKLDERQDLVTMWTAHGANTGASARQRAQRPRFEDVARAWARDGDAGALVRSLESALAAGAPAGEPWHAAMKVLDESQGFGTRSSLIVAFGGEGSMSIRASDEPPVPGGFRDVRG